MEKSTLKLIGKRCKELRENIDQDKKTSQRELAEKMEISYSRISKIENGLDEMTMNELQAYKRTFPECSYDFLLGEAKHKKPSVEAVYKLTGLSKGAVSNLTKLRDCGEKVSDIMNLVIDNQHFISMLLAIDRLALADKLASEYRKYWDSLSPEERIKQQKKEWAESEKEFLEERERGVKYPDVKLSPLQYREYVAQHVQNEFLDYWRSINKRNLENGGKQNGSRSED